VQIVPVGLLDEGTPRGLDRAIREEVEVGLGWQPMPAQVGTRPEHMIIVDPTRYTVAAGADRYLGLLRLVTAALKKCSSRQPAPLPGIARVREPR